MIKQKKSSALIIGLVALIMLLGVLISVLPANAYFTSGEGLKIQAVVHVSPINFQVLQTINSEDILINDATYIDLANGENGLVVLPNDDNDLVLKLKNADTGTSSMGVKFKIEMFVLSAVNNGGTVQHTETPIDITITGYSAATTSSAGFMKNDVDGFYYYVNNTSSKTNKAYDSQTNLYMMQNFVVPQSSFGTYNGENLKIVVTVIGINV